MTKKTAVMLGIALQGLVLGVLLFLAILQLLAGDAAAPFARYQGY